MSTSPKKDQAVDDYIAQFPEEVQERLEQVRKLVQRLVPDAVETISYAIPTYKLNGKPVIYFAGFAKHIGVYPLPERPTPELEADIAPYVTGKGTMQFPHSKPLRLDLIERVVMSRKDQIVTPS